jgi:hypothetical protein
LTELQKKRFKRSKELLARHGGKNLEKIIFSDEKLFTVADEMFMF